MCLQAHLILYHWFTWLSITKNQNDTYMNGSKSTFPKWNFTRVLIILHKRCLWCLWQISCLNKVSSNPNWKGWERDWMSCMLCLGISSRAPRLLQYTNPAISWEIAAGLKDGEGLPRLENWVKLSAVQALHCRPAPSTEVWSDQNLRFIKIQICLCQTKTWFWATYEILGQQSTKRMVSSEIQL